MRLEEASGADVDIQLYDLGATDKWSEGQAIVAYCASADENCGALGNNDGSAESTVYVERRACCFFFLTLYLVLSLTCLV